MSGNVLSARDITVTFKLRRKTGQPQASITAVRAASIDVDAGETLGIVGESGSGKSTLVRAISGLEEFSGTVFLDGKQVNARDLHRSRDVASYRQMVFQDPYSSLDPLMTIAESIAEPLVVSKGGRSRSHYTRVTELLDEVRLPQSYAHRLPSDLSGGQRQRVAIARALATHPSLVICDEAVSALDASTRGDVMALLGRLQADHGLAYAFVAHDLGLVRRFAHRVAVMYLGRIVESGPADEVFSSPQHPYTAALIAAAPIPHPRIQRNRRAPASIGEPPDPSNPPRGCPFHPRCEMAMDVCRDTEPQLTVSGDRTTRCHLVSNNEPPGATSVAMRPSRIGDQRNGLS